MGEVGDGRENTSLETAAVAVTKQQKPTFMDMFWGVALRTWFFSTPTAPSNKAALQYVNTTCAVIDGFSTPTTRALPLDVANSDYAEMRKRATTATFRVVCIGDTHGAHWQLNVPHGDVLVHTGDVLLCGGRYSDAVGLQLLGDFNQWLGTLPHRWKVVVGGNHDGVLATLGRDAAQKVLFNAIYLEYDVAYIPHPVHGPSASISIFGAPFSRKYRLARNSAFQCGQQDLPRCLLSDEAQRAITESKGERPFDICLTHTPIYTRLAPTVQLGKSMSDGVVNCRLAPVHVGGHIHSWHGVRYNDSTLCVVDCILDNKYKPSYVPIVFDYYSASARRLRRH